MITVTEQQLARAKAYDRKPWNQQRAQVKSMKKPESLITLACALATFIKGFQAGEIKLLLERAEELGGDITEAKAFTNDLIEQTQIRERKAEDAAVQAIWDKHKEANPTLLAEPLYNGEIYKVRIGSRSYRGQFWDGFRDGMYIEYWPSSRAKNKKRFYLTYGSTMYMSRVDQAILQTNIIKRNMIRA